MCNPLTSFSCIQQVAGGLTGGGPVIGGFPVSGIAGPAGSVAGAAASSAANSAVGGLAGAIQDALGTIARDTLTWWVNLPSPDLTNDPVQQTLQTWLLPFTAAVAVIGILTAAARMILTRKPTPLADVGSGLLTMAVVIAVGTALPTLLLRAGDAYSSYVLNASTGRQFGARYAELLSFGGVIGGGAAGILIVLGILGIVAGALQAILLIFRQGAVIILAGTLPLAAAGMMTTLTRPWLKKVTGWLLAMIFYKPAAATVYAVGFLMIGQGQSVQEVFVGFAILLLSLVTLPALMRFFTWTTGAVESNSGGGGLLGAVIGGAAAVGAMRAYGGGMSAGDQARQLSSAGSLGASGGGPGGGPPGGPGGGPPGGPGGGPPGGPGGGPPGGPGGGHGGPGANPAAGSGAATGTGQGGGKSAPGAGTSAGPTGAGASGGSAAAAASPASGAAASGAAAAGAAAGPAGMIFLAGAQAAQGAAAKLADGAAPPGDS